MDVVILLPVPTFKYCCGMLVLDSDEIKNYFFRLYCCLVNNNVCSKNVTGNFIISSVFCVILKDVICPIHSVPYLN